MNQIVGLDAGKLPGGIRSRFVEGVNGLRMHILEAGFDPPNRPRVLLLHGFPELAYSRRKDLTLVLHRPVEVAPRKRTFRQYSLVRASPPGAPLRDVRVDGSDRSISISP
jgi:hypothetical protein